MLSASRFAGSWWQARSARLIGLAGVWHAENGAKPGSSVPAAAAGEQGSAASSMSTSEAPLMLLVLRSGHEGGCPLDRLLVEAEALMFQDLGLPSTWSKEPAARVGG